MDFWIPFAFTILLEVLAQKGKMAQFTDRFAKVYVKIEKTAEGSEVLREAIHKQRVKEGLE